MNSKDLLGLLSILIIIVVTLVYIRHMRSGQLKPHILTWIIWALTTGIAAAARTTDGAGAGVWGQWASAASCVVVALLAMRHGEKNITRIDIGLFLAALAAIPAWLLTEHPLAAVIIVTAIDVIGYIPTFRKSYLRPREEAIYNFVGANIIHVLALAATASYTMTNTFFQIVLFGVNSLLITMIWWRRHQIPLA